MGEQHADHLLSVLCEYYVVDKNAEDSKYCGITIDWDYDKHKVHLLMPTFRKRYKDLDTIQQKGQISRRNNVPIYGSKVQYAKKLNKLPRIGPQDKLFI